MARIGQTLLRLTGAVLLGASATSIDNPGLLFAPTANQISASERGSAEPEVRLAPGKVSLSFRFDDVDGVASLLQPNSRVDVVVVTKGSEQQAPMAKLLMENMRVLAMRTVPQIGPDGRSSNVPIVTIEATPDEVERFASARARSSLHLMLRGKE